MKVSEPTGAMVGPSIDGSEALPLTPNYECQFLGIINLGICLPNCILTL